MPRTDAAPPLSCAAGHPPPGWDETVAGLGGSIFHSAAWAEYQRSNGAVTPWFLLQRDAAGRVGAASLAFFRRSPHPLASLIFRDLSLAAHPAALGIADATALVAGCEALGRRAGCRAMAIESFASGHSPFVPAEHGYAEQHRAEFCVDLSKDRGVLWKGLRKDQRERIRRLPREGVTLEVGANLQDLAGLRAAREATRDRRAARGQGYELDADDQFYASLYDQLLARRAARLFVARKDGEVIAALLFATFGERAYSMFSGSLDAGYRLGAQSGLFWLAVETFAAAGLHELNRGGVPAAAGAPDHPLHGIYQFKLRLGTTAVLCRSGHKVLSPVRQRLSAVRDRLRIALGRG